MPTTIGISKVSNSRGRLPKCESDGNNEVARARCKVRHDQSSQSRLFFLSFLLLVSPVYCPFCHPVITGTTGLSEWSIMVNRAEEIFGLHLMWSVWELDIMLGHWPL